MKTSIVIPVWNGESVIAECLDAVYAHSGASVFEVVCVDNASSDDSAALIAERYPQVRLIRQPVNLGFAGGVNIGVEAARGEVYVLLNQDCIVQPGWLAALDEAFEAHSDFGIAGCSVFKPDGTLNHAGATIQQPSARGVHLTEVKDGRPRAVDYVTGAVFAIRRQTWETVGHLDEGYYPAYYEDSDYCYRARSKGFGTAIVPEAHATHLFTGQEWRDDPIKHAANQHRSRYRFVSKHFCSREVDDFFDAECAAVDTERYFDQVIGRVIAARDTLRGLPDIIERRRVDLGDSLAPAHRCQLRMGFTRVLRQAFSMAEKLGPYQPVESLSETADAWQADIKLLETTAAAFAAHAVPTSEAWEAATQKWQALRRREHDLLRRIYFREPSAENRESTVKRLFRLLVLRPLSFFIGRDYLLLAELNTVHVARMDLMDRQRMELIDLMDRQRMELVEFLDRKREPVHRLFKEQRDLMDRRLTLLEILTDYDYH